MELPRRSQSFCAVDRDGVQTKPIEIRLPAWVIFDRKIIDSSLMVTNRLMRLGWDSQRRFGGLQGKWMGF